MKSWMVNISVWSEYQAWYDVDMAWCWWMGVPWCVSNDGRDQRVTPRLSSSESKHTHRVHVRLRAFPITLFSPRSRGFFRTAIRPEKSSLYRLWEILRLEVTSLNCRKSLLFYTRSCVLVNWFREQVLGKSFLDLTFHSFGVSTEPNKKVLDCLINIELETRWSSVHISTMTHLFNGTFDIAHKWLNSNLSFIYLFIY